MTANASTLPLSLVDRRSVTIGGDRPTRPLPMGLAARMARSAHEAIARLVPATARPAIELDWTGGTVRLGTDDAESECSLSDVLERDVAVHRGREGGRLVVNSDGPAFLNGWPLTSGVPHLLGHGDVVRLDDRWLAVRYDPPFRCLVSAGESTNAVPPSDVGPAFDFSIEPSGEPLSVRCESAAVRALAALVLRHDPDRPFDPTALSDVERATLDWVGHRIADRVAGDVFGSRISFRPAPAGMQPEIWASAVVRVGATHGVVWIGTSRAGREAIATVLEPVARRQLAASAAIRGVRVTLSARIDVGRIPATSAAMLASGDLIVARELEWIGPDAWSSPGHVALASTEGLSATAQLEFNGDGRLRAVLLANVYDTGGDPMLTIDRPAGIEGGDLPFSDALDAIGVVVSIEVARKRIRLSEALAMTTGDVIDLGAPLAADVTLMIDGAPFAHGELVNVDGTLGVRIVTTGGRR